MSRTRYIWENGKLVESSKSDKPARRHDINAGERLPERVPRIDDQEDFERKRIEQGGSEKCVGGRWVYRDGRFVQVK